MTHSRIARWIPSLLLILVFLSACSPALSPVAATVEIQAPPPTDTPSDAPEVVETDAPAQAVQPTLVPVKSALEATDPGTVSLASGGPVLVEFFAFW